MEVKDQKCNDCIHKLVCKYLKKYEDISIHVEEETPFIVDIGCNYFRSRINFLNEGIK